MGNTHSNSSSWEMLCEKGVLYYLVKGQYFEKSHFFFKLFMTNEHVWRVYFSGDFVLVECLVFIRELHFLQFEGKGITISAFFPGIGTLGRFIKSIESKNHYLQI